MANNLTTKEGNKVLEIVRSEAKLSNAKVFGAYMQTPIAVTEDGHIGIIIPKASDSTWGRFTEKVGSKSPDNFDLMIIHINDIVGFDLLADKKSGLGGAIVGGALFGDGGAVAGSIISKGKTKAVDLEIRLNDFQNPTMIVPLYNTESAGSVFLSAYFGNFKALAKNAKGYAKDIEREINELLNMLNLIFQRNNSPDTSSVVVQQTSDADELAKFKRLLDDGVISQEEFDAKKKQILGL